MKANKKNLLKLATMLMTVATASGALLLTNSVKTVKAAEGFVMKDGASVRVSADDEEAGLRFEAVIGDYNESENAEYGMMIIRNDWMKAWGITDNYVTEVQAKYDALSQNKDEDKTNDVAAPIQSVAPYKANDKWIIKGTLVGILPQNYDREFFGIAYKKVEGVYTYAATEVDGNVETIDNVRSISSISLGGLLEDSVALEEEALNCFEKYSEAELVKGKDVAIDAETEAKDLTFLMKATKTSEGKNSDIAFSVVGADSTATVTLQLNTESAMDGEFTVESEKTSDDWYKITVNSDLFVGGDTLSFSLADNIVIKDVQFVEHNAYALTVDNTFVSLLTPKTLNGADHSFKVSEAVSVNSEKAYELESKNANVVTTKNGNVTSVASGDTKVLVKSRYASAEVAVRVSYPISSATDMDFLSMVTYKEDKATAEAYLYANYLFTNDIDYSTHTRNYILPIASVNHEHGRLIWSGGVWTQGEDYDNVDRTDTGEFALGGLTRGTYYSIGWKDVLGLTEATIAVGSNTAYYMQNSAVAGYAEDVVGAEFRGINPNGLPFSGRFDGNGYAIKNAFYMTDNLQGQARSGSVAAQNSKGYNGLGGFLVGYNIGTIENLELYVSVANPRDYYYNNGVYSKTQKDGSLKINELYLNADKTAQKVLLHSKGGVHTALTGKYSPHKGSEGTGATGIVAINNGVLQNLYHNVKVYASVAETPMSSQGVIASVNGYKITNCVVDKFDNAYLTGETTIATKTLNEKAGNQGEKPVRYALVNAIKGSQITGCYSLLKRTGTSSAYKAIPKALTFAETAYSGNFYGGTIDTLSNTVYTNFTGTDAVQSWNADYAAMYAAYQTNKNLDTTIWSITYENSTLAIALNDGIVDVQV